jgi:hypothetical protein
MLLMTSSRCSAALSILSRRSACSALRPLASQQVGHAEDAVHRRADLVAHVGQEGALGLVGGVGGVARRRQFEGPDPHLFFEPVAVVAQVILAQGEFGGDLLRLGGLCHVTAAGQQRGRRGHENDRGQEHEVGGSVFEVRGRDDALDVGDQEADENQFGQHGHHQGLARAEHPARDDEDQGVIQQVGTAQAAVDRCDHRHAKPVTPDQDRSGRNLASRTHQRNGDASCNAYPDVQQDARREQRIVDAEQDGQRKADTT